MERLLGDRNSLNGNLATIADRYERNAVLPGFAYRDENLFGLEVERQSRFAMLVKVNGKDTQTVVKALTKQVRRLPAQLRKSLTWDRGLEMAAHKEFSIATDVNVYFCDPQSPCSAEPTRTRTASCASTSRKALTCPLTRKQT